MPSRREEFIAYVLGFQGAPYIYGGQGPGFDCSGIFVEALRALGMISRNADYDCDGLLALFPIVDGPVRGGIVGFGDPDDIEHVMMCLDEEWCFGACGGNSKVLTFEGAQRKHAYVRREKISYRRDVVKYVDPFFEDG